MTHAVLNGAALSEPAGDEDMWEVATTLVDELRAIATECENIAALLQPLARLEPRHSD